MENIKLIITDKGDPSVGLFPQSWEIEAPIFIRDVNKISSEDKEILESFRNSMVGIYKDFCEGRCIAEYNFELGYQDDFE